MRKIQISLIAIFAVLLASCSVKPKQITPDAVKFEDGGLADLVELVNEPCELSYEVTEGEIETQTFVLKAKLKLKEEVPYLKDYELKDIDLTDKVLKVALKDESGKDVKHLRLNKKYYNKLKKFLREGKKGEVVDVVFSARFRNPEKAPEWFKQAVKFAPEGAGDVFPIVYNLDGSIGKYPIGMTLIEYSDGVVQGAYYYKKFGSGNLLFVKGVRSGDRVILDEYTDSGNNSGYFNGKLNKEKFVGEFDALNFGTHYTYEIPTSQDMETLNFEGINFDRLEKGWGVLEIAPGFAEDVDIIDIDMDGGNSGEWLDKFEQYVDDYISLLRKANNDDPTAIADVANMLQDIYDLQGELENIEASMSAADMARLAAINLKLANALAEVQ